MTAPASPSSAATPAPAGTHARRQGLGAVTLAAIGVVYGDIGTSPLYTMKAIFAPHTGVTLNHPHIVGAVSTIFWALMLVVTLKYVILILRADNNGEGGGLALTALASMAVHDRPRLRQALLLLGVFGAALFYGDSVITPAISVLGAVEGLEIATPALRPFVLPITVAVLAGLFALQRFGTAAVGRLFGPVILLWFVVLAGAGLVHVWRQPAILAALNPLQAWRFLHGHGVYALATVGAVVLALTGAEALYADMGHFGPKPIRMAWMGLVLPALALNYMGQGALLMRDAASITNPFYRLFPDSWLIAAIVLATLAAIIASQAVISGAYSMTRQAMLLGFLPRMTTRFTSAREAGQIYMPAVNAALLAGVLAAVLHFGSSAALGAAYGIAVTLTMAITTVLTYFVIHDGWHMSRSLALAATGFFLAIDAILVAGCLIKFFDGGWFPLALGLLIFTAMSTWRRGRGLLLARIHQQGQELKPFIESLDPKSLHRVARAAVYPVADPTTVPQAMLHNMKHFQVIHERNVILTVNVKEVAWVPLAQRIEVENLGRNFWLVTLHFGFMNTPDVPAALPLAGSHGLELSALETSYFLSRETVVPTPGLGMVAWREHLFATMSRNAGGVVEFLRLPDNAVVELGTRVQI